ncbi:hypothetical protein QF047_000967 [Arthrobacter sp. W4I7]|nr:hypothetical protein [Arthrobacter sp. W4I7]
MRWTKGVLALILAGSLALWCSALWSQTFEPDPANTSTAAPSLVAAYSEVPVTQSATFWFNLRPPRPSDKDELGEIRLSYELAGTPAAPTTISFAISGQLGEILSDCTDFNVRINRDVPFDALAAPAKIGLTALARQGSSDGQQPSSSQTVDVSEVSKVLHRDTYTEVQIPVSPKLGGITKSPEVIGSSATHTCNVVEGRKMWGRLTGQPRIVAPAVSAALPSKVARLEILPMISLYTDDLFFLVHSSDEPTYVQGMTEIRGRHPETGTAQVTTTP